MKKTYQKPTLELMAVDTRTDGCRAGKHDGNQFYEYFRGGNGCQRRFEQRRERHQRLGISK